MLRLDVPIKHFVIKLPEPGEDEEAMNEAYNLTHEHVTSLRHCMVDEGSLSRSGRYMG